MMDTGSEKEEKTCHSQQGLKNWTSSYLVRICLRVTTWVARSHKFSASVKRGLHDITKNFKLWLGLSKKSLYHSCKKTGKKTLFSWATGSQYLFVQKLAWKTQWTIKQVLGALPSLPKSCFWAQLFVDWCPPSPIKEAAKAKKKWETHCQANCGQKVIAAIVSSAQRR